MSVIETSFHEYHLETEAIDAGTWRCPECGDVGPNGKLFIFSTVRGRKVRQHGGAFCSLSCHDAYNGLKPRK
jgi:hypothetical protein